MKKLSYVFLISAFCYIGCGPSNEEIQQQEEATEETVQETNDLIEQMAEEQQAAEDSTAGEESDSLSIEEVEGAE